MNHIISPIGRLTRDPDPVTNHGGTALVNLKLGLVIDRRADRAVFVPAKSSEAEARAGAPHEAERPQLAISPRLEVNQPKANDGEKLCVTAHTAQLLASKPTTEHQEQPAAEERVER